MKKILIMLLGLTFTPFLHAAFWLNDIPIVVNPPPPAPKKNSIEMDENINGSISSVDVDAAHSFMCAYQKALQVTDDLELSIKNKIDFEANRIRVTECREELVKTRITIQRIIQAINLYGYNLELRSKLMKHDYNDAIFQLGLNESTAREAQYWLRTGQIREYLVYTSQNIKIIEQLLVRLEYSLARHYVDFSYANAMIIRFTELFQLGNCISQLIREAHNS